MSQAIVQQTAVTNLDFLREAAEKAGQDVGFKPTFKMATYGELTSVYIGLECGDVVFQKNEGMSAATYRHAEVLSGNTKFQSRINCVLDWYAAIAIREKAKAFGIRTSVPARKADGRLFVEALV